MIRNHIVCDRRVYEYTAIWHNPNQDLPQKVFYYVEEPMKLSESFERGIEQLKETLIIRVYGNHPFAKGDTIKLANGHTYKIWDMTIYDMPLNILVRDFVKPKVESMSLVLQ